MSAAGVQRSEDAAAGLTDMQIKFEPCQWLQAPEPAVGATSTVEFFSKWRTLLLSFGSSATILWRTLLTGKNVRHFLKAHFEASATFLALKNLEKLNFWG
jgi:hypothetical protein